MYWNSRNGRLLGVATFPLSSACIPCGVKYRNPIIKCSRYRRVNPALTQQILRLSSFAMEKKSAPMPKLLYGTAWKKDATADLVFLALKTGFRGIDTAAQPRHYREDLVGAAVKQAISSNIVKRDDLFVQTKFTSVDGQDPNNLPYDLNAPLEEQVHSSVASSLNNFRYSDSESDEPYIDSLVLHSPLRTLAETAIVWETLETYVPHKIRQLGISNAPLEVVDYLNTNPDIIVRPACVQNRFYPATHWEVDLRAYCREMGIVFQAFWTLSGNPQLLMSTNVHTLATKANVELPVALYALVLGLGGTSILDGTTNEAHMKSDLEGIDTVSAYARSKDGQHVWSECLCNFKKQIGEK
ncbi:Aldo/keto reductase [Daldinia vernicosa]|uniref:Aldo/keto reductase n=1 Tax=Daldinia vernicosa TaxID=114800 RepID=UPI0020085C3B|nr:Aldo/keto reductase [Daldinia vernicosa]KAI0845759.1 Aldo/keto reductase [Daldinia vernicosa]